MSLDSRVLSLNFRISGRGRTRNDAESSGNLGHRLHRLQRAAQALQCESITDLDRLVDAWPTLSDELRLAILRVAELGAE